MKRKLLVLAFLTLSCGALVAQRSHAGQARAAAEQFGEAWAKNDIATLESYLPADYMHTDTDGKVLDRKQYVAYLNDRVAKDITNKIEFKDVKAREIGGSVVITGENVVSGGLANEKVNAGQVFRIRFTQVWVRRAGKWQRLYFQGTPIL